ncbi:CDP-glycerol glycerophosphotransferase family protein [Rossellomorea aquimaris]|nr:CDP-glycerol glycerophosphotransferase family protein [Rossellomorea aquimaris]WRP06369.1 CDP-glycerol glycerophosphotransferase family protein [Rossellomorea aquimaris]
MLSKIFGSKKKQNDKKLKLKRRLEVVQAEKKLSIRGQLSWTYYQVEELWLASRLNHKDAINVAVNTSTAPGEFHFDVELEGLMKELTSNHEEHAFDWFLKLSVPVSNLSISGLEKVKDRATFFERNQVQYISYFIRLGRFTHTNVENMEFIPLNEHRGLCYVTTKGNLSFLLNREPESPTKIQIDHAYSKPGLIDISGKLFTRNSVIQSASLIMKGRKLNTEIQSPVKTDWNEETKIKFGLNRYEYSATINFSEVCKDTLIKEDVYDLFLKLKLHDSTEEKLVRIGRPTFRAKLFMKDTYYAMGNSVSVINPYYTFKASNLSFEVYKYDLETFKYLQSRLKYAWFHRLFNNKDDVWIVGERPYKAQDTGYHFFKYMRRNHPEKNVFYVIEKDSPERENVDPLGNVIEYKSKEHIYYSLLASKVISSHHPDYLYPIRTKRFKHAVKATKVFLQHGVMGTKNMVANYGKSAPAFNTDLFLVSSDFEKEMIVNDFGYDPKDVSVTGLSRFDSLLTKDVPLKNQILIIPTWRDWIGNEDAFMESEYYERYKELVYHPDIHSLAKENRMEIIFCLHPNMQQFTSHFAGAPVTLINQGEVDVQKLLKESKLMITDYSSVGFDFSFLDKPVIYYQFDRNRFIGKRPSHLDLDQDLPGSIVKDIDSLIQELRSYGDNNFIMRPEYQERSLKFLKYKDLNSSERIFNAISHYQPKKPLYLKVAEKPISKALFNRFRKSKWYFPTMKWFYRIARRVLSIDEKLIVFESGIGKQYADSPRYIYEELLNRNPEYKKVWVYNQQMRFNDENTIRIKRLSPQYYYYLAKARYWVNNQNFPTYIEKRKGTTYIQTWHGTPLKKMLFDIENIQGRSDDYLERVHHATKQWDYLISPSEYATKAFRSAFKYNGEMLEVGYPRNDLFYRGNTKALEQKIKSRLGLPDDKKIILYAPTFRDNETNGKNKFIFDIKMDLHRMKKELGDNYIILMRMHVIISSKLSIPEELSSFVYNVSKYPEIQELYLISNILMTDYSSVMFDFANTNQPILYYTYDFEEYKNDIRGFYMDFQQEAPGPFLYNTEDIINSVKNIDEISRQYQEKYTAFRNKFCSLEDGQASKRIVDRFFN